MENNKMTIHRGLAELKIIDDRIQKAIAAVDPVGFLKTGGKVNGVYSKEDFETHAKAKNQSAIDLINRKAAIKSAIVQANATTMVEIGGKQMTIADAINFRSVIEHKQILLQTLKQKRSGMVTHVETTNAAVDNNALQLAKTALAKDNVKIEENDAQAIIGPYTKANRIELVDPLKVDELIETLDNEILDFKAEIDATLSEVNATTMIEIK